MQKFLLALVFMLSGCGVLVESSTGHPLGDTREGFFGAGPIVRGALIFDREYTPALTGFCEVQHLSNLFAGWPVNDDLESEINTVGCGLRYRFH